MFTKEFNFQTLFKYKETNRNRAHILQAMYPRLRHSSPSIKRRCVYTERLTLANVVSLCGHLFNMV